MTMRTTRITFRSSFQIEGSHEIRFLRSIDRLAGWDGIWADYFFSIVCKFVKSS